jgi:hypothetical protein
MVYEITNTYRTWINRLLLIFFIFTLFFPVLLINKLVFLAIISLMFFNYKLYRFRTISPWMLFLIFFFGFLHSFFHYSDMPISQQFFLSTLVLFLIYPIDKYKIDVDKMVKVSGVMMTIYTWMSFLIVTTVSPLSGAYYDFFFYYSIGSYNVRNFVEEGILTFQMGTLPFLFVPLLLQYISFLKDKKYSRLFFILVFFMTIGLGGSRSSIITTIFTMMLISFIRASNLNKIIFLMISIPILMNIGSYLLLNTNVFDSGEISNTVKIGHFNSFWKNLNLYNFFLGEGLGSYYYSEGSGVMKSYTEVTPLDLLRYFGFVFTPIIYSYIFFPVKRLSAYLGDNLIYFVVFFLYVINSMTNPTFLNSYGFLVVLWYWSKILIAPEVKKSELIID